MRNKTMNKSKQCAPKGMQSRAKLGSGTRDGGTFNVTDSVEVTNSKVNFRKKPVTRRAESDSIQNMLTNDPSFYNHSPELLRTNLSFAMSAGSPIVLSSTGDQPAKSSIPMGIMEFDMIHGVGWSNDGSSALNIASTDVYSFVRHENSGARNYDAPDLLLYVLAMDEAYMLFENARRAYGSAFLFSAVNKFVPEAILTAEGWNAQDVINNLAQFHDYLNIAVGKLNSLNVPNQFALIERHRRLYRGIYMDDATGKSQIYLMKPQIYRTFSETDGAGSLKTSFMPTLTVSQWWTIFNNVIEAIRQSEDCGVISGDILKAYGTSNMITVEPVPLEYSISPVADITLLRQFKNATPATNLITTNNAGNFNITQQTGINGFLKYNPQIWVNTTTPITGNSEQASLLEYDKIVDLSIQDPTPMDVMEATRLKMQAVFGGTETVSGQTYNKYNLEAVGSEFVSNAWIVTLSGGSSITSRLPFFGGVYNGASSLA